MKKYYNIHTVWVALLLLTLASYITGKLGYSGTPAVLFLLATAVIKSHFIIGDFMELRGVSFLWRAIMYGWLWIISITIVITYMISQ